MLNLISYRQGGNKCDECRIIILDIHQVLHNASIMRLYFLKILLAQFAILQRKDIHSTRLSTDNHLYCHCIGNLMIEQSNRKNDAQGVGNSITKNFNVLLHF